MPKKSSFWKNNLIIIQGFFVILFLFPIFRLRQLGQPVGVILGNLSLLTLRSNEYTKSLWEKYVIIDTSVKFTPQQIPEILGKDFDMESLRHATDNWRHPAVVRGLFEGTPALEKWLTAEYLSSVIGEYKISVLKKAKYGTLQEERAIETFRDSFTEIIENDDSKAYLFFPVLSRFDSNLSEVGRAVALQKAVNDVIAKDLKLSEKLWHGFGTKAHKTFLGGQFVIGKGSADTNETTGTGWHCAAGNNWFIQVAGSKRWYFMDPEYSAYVNPVAVGMNSMRTSRKDMAEMMNHIPLRFTDLGPGDMLYNPDWEWHTIFNHEGLSIGVPIREINITLSLRNNFVFSSVVIRNQILMRLGLA